LDENGKDDCQDMYRPPGVVRVRNEYFPPDKKPIQVDLSEKTIDAQNFGNTKDVDTYKDNFKTKVEKSIWMTIPTKSLYLRKNIESELLVIANAQRFDKIEETYWKEYKDKQNAKGIDANAKGIDGTSPDKDNR
jgi:hypothetical protein